MNLPLRLARGEMLYSQAGFLYGPFSPYFHAALFAAFGPSLNILYADGIITATLILLLTYWLSRVWMSAMTAAVAALLVAGMCAMKPGGSYILPYSYSALHGCLAALSTLALTVRYAQGRRLVSLLGAGVCAAIAVIAKTEFGIVAVVTGVVTAVLTEAPDGHRISRALMAFLCPAVGISGLTYSAIISLVGWHVLSQENHVFFANPPEELIAFNRWISGTDSPVKNCMFMLGLTLQMVSCASVIALVSDLIMGGRRRSSGEIGTAREGFSRLLTIALGSGLIGGGIARWYRHESGPFVAMPLVLGLLIAALLRRYWKAFRQRTAFASEDLALLITAVFAFGMLGRVILRVRSGGSYASYFLPATVIVFSHIWVDRLPTLLARPRARVLASRIAWAALAMATAAISIAIVYQYRSTVDYRLATPRGVLWTDPDLGSSFDGAMHFIEERTSRDEFVAVLPEGTSLDFFSDRRNPLKQEITAPGYLDAEGEARAIEQLRDSNTRLVMVTNRSTPEFGVRVFGQDYDRRLMAWIASTYRVCGVLGRDTRPPLELGDERFFIRAYCRD
jgi:hypothetical protein